jgi:hypothetical protein
MKSYLGTKIDEKSLRDFHDGILRIALKYVPGYDLTRSADFLDFQINSDETKIAIYTGTKWKEVSFD